MNYAETRQRAIDTISTALQEASQRGLMSPGQRIRPIAELIYPRICQDVWSAVTEQMNEDSARRTREAAAADPHYWDGWVDKSRGYHPGFMDM